MLVGSSMKEYIRDKKIHALYRYIDVKSDDIIQEVQMKINELDDTKIEKYLNEFYRCFATGYEFEEFLKVYLRRLGLDEIQITKRSKDGGIDLKALRNGIGNFSNSDSVEYYIQAKRYETNKVNVSVLRELKGVIPFGHKGMLITTSGFTKDVINEASNDPSKPVTLVDGKTLLRSCIENGIGFTFEPKFSPEELKKFITKEESIASESENINMDNVQMFNQEFIEKEITENDIRARILSVPSKIANLLEDRKKYKILFENATLFSIFIKGRNYFSGGVSKMYRDYGLISSENVITSRKALWKLYDNQIFIKLK